MTNTGNFRFALVGIVLALVGCAKTPARIVVMSYNIHHGVGEDNVLDLKRIADVIKQNNVDIVAIQEVDQGTKRVGGIHEKEELVKLTGMHGVFGKAEDFDGGEYGQVILSRFEIESSTTHMLPGTPGREPRIAVEARINPDEGLPPIVMMGTHLDHQVNNDRVQQAKELVHVVSGIHGAEVILAGDMNCGPEAEPVKLLLKHFKDTTGPQALSYPAGPAPNRKIDWILCGNGWSVVGARVVDESVASDHRPVLAELQWMGSR